MNVLSVAALLIAILGANSQIKDYCPDNLCVGDYYENRETDECFSDHNCEYGRKCCKGCTYNICVEPIFKEYVVGNGDLMRDKYCPKVQKCYTPLKYDVRYRCGSDEACTFGYKCCWTDCYIHRVCVAPTDKEGNQVLPPHTTTTVASTTRLLTELPKKTQTPSKEEEIMTSSTHSSSTLSVTTQKTFTEDQGSSHETEFSGSGDDDDDDEEDDNKTTQGLISTFSPLYRTTEFTKSITTLSTNTTPTLTTVQNTTFGSTIAGSGDGFTTADDEDSSEDGEWGSGDDNFTIPNHSTILSTIKEEASTTVSKTTQSSTDTSSFVDGFTMDDDDHENGSGETTHKDTTTSLRSTTLIYVITDETTAQKSTDFAGSGDGHTEDEDEDEGSGDYTIKTDQPEKTSPSVVTRSTVTTDFEFSEDTTLSSKKPHVTTFTSTLNSSETSLTTNDINGGGSGDGFTDEETVETSQLTKRSTYFTSTKLTTLSTTEAVEGSGFSDNGDDEDLTSGPLKTSFASTTTSDFDFSEDKNFTSTKQTAEHTMPSTVEPTIKDPKSNFEVPEDGGIAWTIVETPTTEKPLMLTTSTIIEYVTNPNNVFNSTKSPSSSNPLITDIDEGSGLSDYDDEDLSSTVDIKTTNLPAKSSSQIASIKPSFTNAEEFSKTSSKTSPTLNLVSSDDDFGLTSVQTTQSEVLYVITDFDYGEEFITTIESEQITSTTKPKPLQINSKEFDDNLTSNPLTSPVEEFSTTKLADGLSTSSKEVSKADFTYEDFDQSTRRNISTNESKETLVSSSQSSTINNGSDFNNKTTVGPNSSITSTPANVKIEEKSKTESLYKKILNSLEEVGDNDVNSGDGDVDDDNDKDDVEIFSAFNETLRSLE